MSGLRGDFNFLHPACSDRTTATPEAARKLYRADLYKEDKEVVSSSLTLKPAGQAATVHDRFAGNNGQYEIETLEEFLEVTKGMKKEEIGSHQMVFQEVDFSPLKAEDFLQYNFNSCHFWGCTFPNGVDETKIRAQGANIEHNNPNLPFKAFRAFMYKQSELMKHDKDIYELYLHGSGIKLAIQQTLHDHSIRDAMGDYLEGKTPVGVMGGHGMKRASAEYKCLVLLARRLAKEGFLIVTGGGPGAMEAANLGAYMAGRTEADVDEALALLSVGNDKVKEEYQNIAAADSVLARFGMPTFMPSLGVPTWKYGHEPSNRFATWHAKFFSNALREADLLEICSGGVIFTQGSAGTRQEIFQASCTNHYATADDCAPMILVDTKFWNECGVWQVLDKTSKGRPYQQWLKCTDSVDEIVAVIVAHAKAKNLPLIKNLSLLDSPHWHYRGKPI